jgi:ribosome-associated protein
MTADTTTSLPPVPGAVESAAQAASDRLGRDIELIFVGDVLAITDWFVIVSASNTRQVRAVADEITDRLRTAHGVKPLRIEGLSEAQWVLLDYADFVVHVFHEDTRRFYSLERLWADCPSATWVDPAAPVAQRPSA